MSDLQAPAAQATASLFFALGAGLPNKDSDSIRVRHRPGCQDETPLATLKVPIALVPQEPLHSLGNLFRSTEFLSPSLVGDAIRTHMIPRKRYLHVLVSLPFSSSPRPFHADFLSCKGAI